MYQRVPCFLWFWLLAFVALPAIAAPGVVEVVNVDFKLQRATPAAPGSWYEIDLALDVRPAADSPGRMLNRVRVTLELATETVLAANTRREYYRAEAELAPLDAGRHHVRFYLPPEIVKRDALRGAAREWATELAVDGKTLPPAPTGLAPALHEPAALAGFRAKVAAATENSGLLQPQYLTPFEWVYPRDTPTYVRRG
jgi:hypothetical protein